MTKRKEVAAPPPIPDSDFSEKDLRKIELYKEHGLEGIAQVNDAKLYRMADLYLGGSTYHQIAQTMNLKRTMIMYLSKKYGWYEAKQEYMQELGEHMKTRIISAKIMSQDFLLLLNQAWQKKVGSKLRAYLATDEETHTDEIDLKEVQQLLKTIELVNDLANDGKSIRGPAVGLNLTEGMTIERNGDNKVTITPAKDKTLGEMLKKFADDRRAEDEASKPIPKSDIIVEPKETKS